MKNANKFQEQAYGLAIEGNVSSQIDLAETDHYAAIVLSLMKPLGFVFLVATWVLSEVLSPGLTLTWGCLYGAFIVIRVASVRSYQRKSDVARLKRLALWRKAFFVMSTLNGLVWGGLCFFMLPVLSPDRQILLTWVPVVSGAVASIAVPMGINSLRIYLLVALGPCAVAWFAYGGPAAGPMALSMILLFWIYGGVGQRNLDNTRERLSYARKLAAANELLEKSNRSKSRLVVEVSHDLRQPVHTLGMMLDRVDPRAPIQELESQVQGMRCCVETLSGMLVNLLDLSKLESGEYLEELQPVDLGSILEELDGSFADMAERRGLYWSVDFCRIWVLSDPIMLRRVIDNLVTNSFKYTLRGSVSVRCRVEGSHVHLEVVDTGKGIPEDKLDIVFTEFVRLDDASEEPGYGIGLAVVKRMLSLLQHPLKVKSQVGAGSNFSLELNRIDTPEQYGERPEHPGDSLLLDGKLIIFIENDVQLRFATVEVLRGAGAQVLAGHSVQEILDKANLRERCPDLVISDMHLDSGVNGLESISALRDVTGNFNLPAILLTGDLTPELGMQARKLKIRIAYKPMRPTKFRELVVGTL